jgi:ribose transport system permease protein
MTVVATDPQSPTEQRPRPRWGTVVRLQRRHPVMQVAALALLFAYGCVSIDGFATKSNIYTMLVLASILGFAALGPTVVVLLGGIDLSISGFMGVGVIAMTDLPSKGWSSWATIGAVIGFALVVGATNGFVAHRFKVPLLIVTLGMGTLLTGVLLVWTDGGATDLGSAPPWLSRLTAVSGKTLGVGIPPSVVIWAVVAIAVGIGLKSTTAGRRLYHVGANPRAGELANVRVGLVWVAALAFSAVSASLAGVILVGFSGSGDVTVATPYLFQGLAAVIVGGTAFGARGDYWRTVLGALLVTVLSTILIGSGVDSSMQQVLYGVLILLVVAAYSRDARVSDRV